MITSGDLEFYDGPVAVVALLIGLTLALWQPRNDPTQRRPPGRPLPPPVVPGSVATIVSPLDDANVLEPDADGSAEGSDRWTHRVRRPARRRPRREPSILGRATLGLAVIVAAAGALIDQFNGGRLHPEQWLGAAAIVCGVGLLVGVVRGRAWWLIVPALLFAGTGYVAGLMSRLGIDAVDTFGDQSLYVSDSNPGGTATLQSGFGSIWITVDGAPVAPLTIDARAALGPVELRVVDDVAIEIRSDSDGGDLIVDGIAVPNGVTRLGPDGPPDVIVDSRQGIGDTVVFTYFPDDLVREIPPELPGGDPAVPPVSVAPDVVPVPPVTRDVPPAPSTTIGE